MRAALFVATAFFAASAGTRAEAEPLFTMTALGPSVTFVSDADSFIHGVTNAAGDVTYAFEKAPVTFTGPPDGRGLETIQSGSFVAWNDHWGRLQLHESSIGWRTWNEVPDPINDINRAGQAVGQEGFIAEDQSARFSLPGLQSHPWTAPPGASTESSGPLGDILSTYVAQQPGRWWLTSAFKIDEVGQILARDNEGQIYLLTPSALGPPSTVPEPTALAVLAAAGIAAGVRSIRRGRRGNREVVERSGAAPDE